MNPMLSHERAVKRIGRYLLGTKDRGLVHKPDMSKGLECYVDAVLQVDRQRLMLVIQTTSYLEQVLV